MNLEEFNTVKQGEIAQELELNHAVTGKPTGVFVSLLSVHSRQYRQAFHDQKIKFALLSEKGDAGFEAEPECACEVLASVSTGIRGATDSDGNEIKPSHELFLSFYAGSPNVADQVAEFVGDLGNFTKG